MEAIDSFWQNLTQCIPAKYDDWPKLLLADANCRFGDLPNHFIGGHDAETSTPKSEAFCQFVAAHQIFLPASFETSHIGPSVTWKHPGGNWARNDVIGVPTCWPFFQCKSWIHDDMDVSIMKDDPDPQELTLNGRGRRRDKSPRSPA